MLQITIPGTEYYDEVKNEFVSTKSHTLQLEHSLVSMSKWESKWKKPFLSDTPHTAEETLDYIQCMTITSNVDPKVYYGITPEILMKVQEYIGDPMTATTITYRGHQTRQNETITSELIYYWMIASDIPFECQKWHLNRLLMLIRVCDIKNAPAKKMEKSAIYAQNAALNAARRKRSGSKG